MNISLNSELPPDELGPITLGASIDFEYWLLEYRRLGFAVIQSIVNGFMRSTEKDAMTDSCDICGFFCPPILVIHRVKCAYDLPEKLLCLCPNCRAVVDEIIGPGKEMYSESRIVALGDWAQDAYSADQYRKIISATYGPGEFLDK